MGKDVFKQEEVFDEEERRAIEEIHESEHSGMKGIGVKRPGVPFFRSRTGETYRLDAAKEEINGTLQAVKLNKEGTLVMFIDEDGKIKKGMDPNFFMPFENPIEGTSKVEMIMGTAVFARGKLDESEEPVDYKVEDLTDEDYSLLESIFDEDFQLTLRQMYMKR